jgi:hypothetical protein
MVTEEVVRTWYTGSSGFRSAPWGASTRSSDATFGALVAQAGASRCPPKRRAAVKIVVEIPLLQKAYVWWQSDVES